MDIGVLEPDVSTLPAAAPVPTRRAVDTVSIEHSGRSRASIVLALQARALAYQRFSTSATAVATELALMLGCERVSLGFLQHGRARVCATSASAELGPRSPIMRNIAAAMDEALDQNGTIVHPLPPGAMRLVTMAHAELMRSNGGAAVLCVPIVGHGQTLGALLCERLGGFDGATMEIAKDVASLVGPTLALQHRLDQPLSGRLVDAVQPRQEAGRARAPGTGQVLAGVAALALLATALWPAMFRVLAPVRVVGAGQQVIAAPVDGYVRSVALRPGEAVKAGQVLLTLEDRELQLERDKLSAEISQLDNLYRDALTKEDAAQIVMARSKREQVQAQLELVLSQLERTQLRSPIDGVLIAGDLSQAIGTPVKRGQELLTVAPDTAYRLVAEVDEQDVAPLREGQRGQVLFGAFSQRHVQMLVTRIAPVASVVDGRNVFEVDGTIELDATAVSGVDTPLRPGLRGVVRIDIHTRALGATWWQRARHALQRAWWRIEG